MKFVFQVADLKNLKQALIANKPDTLDLCCKLKSKYSQKLNLNRSFPRSNTLQQFICKFDFHCNCFSSYLRAINPANYY